MFSDWKFNRNGRNQKLSMQIIILRDKKKSNDHLKNGKHTYTSQYFF